jgi:hypothetical protein
MAEPASRGSGKRALARLLVVPAACAACEELKTFAAGRDLTDWGLCDFGHACSIDIPGLTPPGVVAIYGFLIPKTF